MQFTVDLELFLRIFAGFSWGILWAIILQHTRHGQFLVEDRTWLTVVIGVGLDLAIAWPGDWYTVTAVIVASSVGIIWRSLHNEAAQQPFRRNKVIHGLEDAIARVISLTEHLNDSLVADDIGLAKAEVSRALSDSHSLQESLRAARRGEYVGEQP